MPAVVNLGINTKCLAPLGAACNYTSQCISGACDYAAGDLAYTKTVCLSYAG